MKGFPSLISSCSCCLAMASIATLPWRVMPRHSDCNVSCNKMQHKSLPQTKPTLLGCHGCPPSATSSRCRLWRAWLWTSFCPFHHRGHWRRCLAFQLVPPQVALDLPSRFHSFFRDPWDRKFVSLYLQPFVRLVVAGICNVFNLSISSTIILCLSFNLDFHSSIKCFVKRHIYIYIYSPGLAEKMLLHLKARTHVLICFNVVLFFSATWSLMLFFHFFRTEFMF